MNAPRRVRPEAPSRRGWCPGLSRPMPTGDGLLARIHPPLGILSLAQGRAVAEAARRFGNGHVDVTARANLQVRGVTETTRAPLAAFLEAAGLGDARHDGGPQRLTLTGPLAGLDPHAPDTLCLARTIEALGLAVAGLPAKTLVLVDDGSPDLAGLEADIHVRVHAPGRIALGLGTDDGPRWIAECDAAEVADAVAILLKAFAANGHRRMRDLSPDELLGIAASLPRVPFPSPSAGYRLHTSPLSGNRASRSKRWAAPSPVRERVGVRDPGLSGKVASLTLSLSRTGEGTRASSAAGEDGLRVSEGRERGATGPDTALPSPDPLRGPPSPAEGGGRSRAGLMMALAVEAPFGRCTADALDRLADACASFGAQDIRLSPSRGFVLAAPASASQLKDAAATLSADFITSPDDPRRAVAACPGAPACASGSTPVPADAARLAEAFRPFAARGLKAHVSGCAKGCAHPARADLTLVGREGRYGLVLSGSPGDSPAAHLTFETVLERVRSSEFTSLAEAFQPETVRTPT